jgi:hypothetical protein
MAKTRGIVKPEQQEQAQKGEQASASFSGLCTPLDVFPLDAATPLQL